MAILKKFYKLDPNDSFESLNISFSAVIESGPRIPTELSDNLVIFLSICYGLVSFCAVIGNFIIILILCRSPRMWNVTNYFIANLSVADIFIGFFAIPFQFQAAMLQRWDLPRFMCAFCPTVTIVSLNVSIFTLTAIAVNRYRAICFPLTFRTRKHYTKSTILAIWALAIILATPTPFAFSVEMMWDVRVTEFVPVCTNIGLPRNFFKVYNYLLVAIQYLVPVLIVFLVYNRIASVIRQHDGIFTTLSENVRRKRQKVIRMLFLVMALFTVCWLPLQLYNIVQGLYPQIDEYRHINLVWFACHWLAMSNSCYNPFIYLTYSKNFKREIVSLFGGCCPGLPKRAKEAIIRSLAGKQLVIKNNPEKGMEYFV